jgi:formylglycine-generating enzyme
MQRIEAGAVTITDRRTERCWTVEVAPFQLSPLQVTRREISEAYGFGVAEDDLLPATNTSWFEAVDYCNRVSELAGLRPAYTITGEATAIAAGESQSGENQAGQRASGEGEVGEGQASQRAVGRRESGKSESGAGEVSKSRVGWFELAEGETVVWDRTADGYRLPTEAEWEYACRAGTTGPRYGELDEIAWYRGNSDERLHRGGEKAPNAWGLYDMIGNAWEWCFDVYDVEVYKDYRVIKGGGWFDEHWSCRAGVRRRTMPTLRIDDLGFRLARNAS